MATPRHDRPHPGSTRSAREYQQLVLGVLLVLGAVVLAVARLS